jgi:hypothetical protein
LIRVSKSSPFFTVYEEFSGGICKKHIKEIFSQSQLRIANGRSFGDLTGEFTSHSTLGSSVIDYFVISEAILG